MRNALRRFGRRLLKATFEQVVRIQFRLRPPRPLFILGHIRSGSSLLLHILNSNLEIRALGESWLVYEGIATLEELAVFVHSALKNPFVTETYLVDKILHDELLRGAAEHEVLRSPAFLGVFLVREPERSLRSMVTHRERLKSITDWQSAIEHYEERLSRLVSQARTVGDRRRAFFVRYEQLLDDASRSLQALTRFLRLRTPLSASYRVNRFTGIAGLGDFSDHIKSGTIVRTEADARVIVPSGLLERGERAHRACVAELETLCTYVPPGSGSNR